MIRVVASAWRTGFVLGVLLVSACSSQPANPVQPGAAPLIQARSGGGGGGGGSSCTPASPLVITTSQLPNGNVGTFYGNYITSSGGSGTPHTFKLIAGRLPSGLTMASSFGVQSTSITGTPTTVETQSFTVQVTDGCGNTATKALAITIDAARPLVITNPSSTLRPGTVGSSYAANLFADGGVQPYRWAVVAGQLPPGIVLNSNQLSGRPTTAGTFTFTVRVTDNTGAQASREFSITVS
jgi:Putative Ig domain